MNKLSHLQDGDIFRFKKGQKVFYLDQHNTVTAIEMITDGFTKFVVIKKNPTSVKCKPAAVGAFVEYTFKFAHGKPGYYMYFPIDCIIKISKRSLNNQTYPL